MTNNKTVNKKSHSHYMRTGLRPLGRALSLGLGLGVLPLSAHALLMSSTTYSFDGENLNTGSATDAGGGGSTTDTLSGSTSINQFGSGTGVLMGTTLQLSSTRTQTLSGGGTNQQKTGTAAKATTGTGTTTNTSLSAPGANMTFSTVSTTSSCGPGAKGSSCTYGPTATNTATNTTLSVAAGSLDSYVGSGTVAVTDSATLTATSTQGTFQSSKTTYTLDWTGKLTVTYDYLLHADPSFDESSQMLTMNLDFGTVFMGDPDATLDFSIFNPGGERVGLDLDSFVVSGDDPELFTNLAMFAGLGAGMSNLFTATLSTANLGSFAESYTLNLSDADVGAPSSRFNYILTLNLTGNVIEPQQAVPEPATLALFGAGLMGLGWLRRRRFMGR